MSKLICSFSSVKNRRRLGTGPSNSESQSGGVASSIASSPTDTLRASKKPFILVHVVFRCKNTGKNDAGACSANSREVEN